MSQVQRYKVGEVIWVRVNSDWFECKVDGGYYGTDERVLELMGATPFPESEEERVEGVDMGDLTDGHDTVDAGYLVACFEDITRVLNQHSKAITELQKGSK